MSEISTETKPSEALEVEVLFPCECGNTDDYHIRLIAHSQAGFESGLGSNQGVGGYDGIEIDGAFGVQCECCEKIYQPIEAEKACNAYRAYLDCENLDEKHAALGRFLRARKKAEKASDSPSENLDL